MDRRRSLIAAHGRWLAAVLHDTELFRILTGVFKVDRDVEQQPPQPALGQHWLMTQTVWQRFFRTRSTVRGDRLAVANDCCSRATITIQEAAEKMLRELREFFVFWPA